MINEKETFKRFGYKSAKLSKGSAKKVVRECDTCHKLDEVAYYSKNFTYCHKCSTRTKKFRGTVSARRKGAKNSPEHTAALVKANTGRKDTKEVKEKKRQAQLGKKHTAAAKKKMSDAKKGKKPWNYGVPMNPEYKANHLATRPRNPLAPEHKKAISDAHKGKHEGELNCMFGRTGDKAPRWLGGISYLPYCDKFDDDFKECIRNKHNRRCFLCGTTEKKNGRKLAVHHVNYHKNCLCDDVTCEFVPLCLKCHGKTSANRKCWEKRILDKLVKQGFRVV